MGPSEEAVAAALEWATGFIESSIPPNLARDRAIDAATDALMWSIENYRPVFGSFMVFYRSALRTWLMRADYRWRAKLGRRGVLEFSNSARLVRFKNAEGVSVRFEVRQDWVDPKTTRDPLAPTIRDLEPALARVAWLYVVGGLTMREIASWRDGVSPNTVMIWLNKAAREIATPGARAKVVKKGSKKRHAG